MAYKKCKGQKQKKGDTFSFSLYKTKLVKNIRKPESEVFEDDIAEELETSLSKPRRVQVGNVLYSVILIQKAQTSDDDQVMRSLHVELTCSWKI